MDDAVAGGHVWHRDGGVVDHHAAVDGEGERLTVHGVRRHAFRHGGRRHASSHHVVQEDVFQDRLAFRRVQRGKVDAGVGEGLVGWGKERERARALERFEQFGLDDRGHEAVVDARAGGRTWDVVGRVRGREHLVDDVDDAVAGGHVREGHGGVVDHHATGHGEREGLAVGRVGGHALGHVRGRHIALDDVVEEDVAQGGLAFRGVEISQVDARVGKGLVGWCEDGEGPIALQGFQQLCLNHAGHQGVVQSGALCRPWDVVWCVGRHQDLVNDVDQTVRRDDVRQHDVGVVDHHATGHGEGKRLAVGGIRGHALRDVGRGHVSADDVVQQDVAQGGLAFRGGEIGQVDACVSKGLVGRREDREGPRPLEGRQQLSLNHGRHQAVVDARGLGGGGDVHRWHQHFVDDVNDAVRGLNVGHGDVGVADGDAVGIDAELDAITVDRGGKHAVAEGARGHLSGHHVVEKNRGERCVLLRRVKGAEVDARFRKGGVRRCEDREGSRALERGDQIGMRQGGHKRVVDAGCCSVGRDVLRRVSAGGQGEG